MGAVLFILFIFVIIILWMFVVSAALTILYYMVIGLVALGIVAFLCWLLWKLLLESIWKKLPSTTKKSFGNFLIYLVRAVVGLICVALVGLIVWIYTEEPKQKRGWFPKSIQGDSLYQAVLYKKGEEYPFGLVTGMCAVGYVEMSIPRNAVKHVSYKHSITDERADYFLKSEFLKCDYVVVSGDYSSTTNYIYQRVKQLVKLARKKDIPVFVMITQDSILDGELTNKQFGYLKTLVNYDKIYPCRDWVKPSDLSIFLEENFDMK